MYLTTLNFFYERRLKKSGEKTSMRDALCFRAANPATLQDAVFRNDHEEVKKLIKNGVDVNAKEMFVETSKK